MRTLLAIVVLTITAMSLAQTTDKGTEKHGHDEGLVMQIERDLTAAIQKGDTSPFERYLADTYVFTDADGGVMDKTRLVSDLKSGDLKLETSMLDDLKVQVYDKTAVATFSTNDKGSYKGKDISGQYRWTDVFIKRKGQWQMVASQGTRLAKP
jgi:hypothetical protein